MKKALFLIPLFLTIPTAAFAATEAHVDINNHVSSSSNSQTNSQTNITIETNGQTTHYSTNETGHIEANSINGQSEIKVNGTKVSGDDLSTTPTKETTPSVSPTDEDKNDKKIKDDRDEFREKIIEQLKRPFEMLRHLLFFWH